MFTNIRDVDDCRSASVEDHPTGAATVAAAAAVTVISVGGGGRGGGDVVRVGKGVEVWWGRGWRRSGGEC